MNLYIYRVESAVGLNEQYSNKGREEYKHDLQSWVKDRLIVGYFQLILPDMVINTEVTYG